VKKILLAEVVVLLILIVVAVFVRLGTSGSGETKPDPTEPPTQNTEATQPTEATEVFNPTPTVPPIEVTWMTFPEDRQLTARQYFVYELESSSFLTISGNRLEKIYPASVTKLFTAYVALQYLQPETVVTATDALDLVVYGSSVAGITYRERLSVEQLVEAMLLPSGNDAAYVLAAEVGRVLDNEPYEKATVAVATFMEEMNRQAQQLGLSGTHFVNPDGIHKEDHYSTPQDLVTMASLALQNPIIMKYTQTHLHMIDMGGGYVRKWKNTNELIDPSSEYYCPYAVGLKTGQTPSAGSCLLSAFQFEGRTLIIGVFGCPEIEDRFADTLQLLNETLKA